MKRTRFLTMGNGIWKYTPSTGKFKSYIYGDNSQSGLRSNSISAFMEDSRGNIWVSTDRGGISRYEKAEDRFTTFGIAEGLPDDVPSHASPFLFLYMQYIMSSERLKLFRGS